MQRLDSFGQDSGHHALALLASQFEALEEPAAEESALVVDIRQAPEQMVEEIVSSLAEQLHL